MQSVPGGRESLDSTWTPLGPAGATLDLDESSQYSQEDLDAMLAASRTTDAEVAARAAGAAGGGGAPGRVPSGVRVTIRPPAAAAPRGFTPRPAGRDLSSDDTIDV